MVTGDGTTAQEFMYMTMDIGQGQDQDDHMNQGIGIADLVVNTGSEDAGTEKMMHHVVHMMITKPIGKCEKVFKLLYSSGRSFIWENTQNKNQ